MRLRLRLGRRRRARVEGLAAGTGILTGDSGRRWAGPEDEERPCPECEGSATIEVLDLVERRTTWRCRACGHEWVDQYLPR